MKPVLHANHLTKIYNNKGQEIHALKDVTLNIGEGEFVGIMGPSGSGKTTLLNIVATIDQPTSGQVIIDDQRLERMNEKQLTTFRKDRLGFVFQDFNLLDTLTMYENIALPLVLNKIPTKEIDKKVHEVSQLLGIEQTLKQYPYEVSGGQKQRASSARAIINNPAMVLADEPTGALDSKSSTDLLNCFRRMNEENKATIMMVTHDAFAASYCKRILFIKDGSLYTQLVRGESRKAFYDDILDVLKSLGGGQHGLD